MSNLSRHTNSKYFFTAGPACIVRQAVDYLDGCFGRGDIEYSRIENWVEARLLDMTSHSHLIRLQGAATFALEIALTNFVQGRVLAIVEGFYSRRIIQLLKNGYSSGTVSGIEVMSEIDASNADFSSFDWIVCVHVETGEGLKIDLENIYEKCRSSGAKLLVDATASIGLEDLRGLSDVCIFSSCKGLFGLTGASFVASNCEPKNRVRSMMMDWHTHRQKLITGPYHQMQSLFGTLQVLEQLRDSVVTVKKNFMELAVAAGCRLYETSKQPFLCTAVDKAISVGSLSVIYTPRESKATSVICHLGEGHLGDAAKGDINSRICFD